jgi:hypothetical protein
MKSRHIVLLSLLVSMVLFGWVTWPLGEYIHSGMPSSHRPEAGGPRAMIPGDHLQFLFQLWMLADAVEGKTPLFYHVYEFNQGNDADRREVGTYYFPFGLLYVAGHALGGRAMGWNLMLFVSAWLTYLMTWVLARRFAATALTAAVAALPGLMLPYLWTCILGGSPTGLGMMWVPVIFYGIDKAIRDRRVWGGFLAGVALFVAPWGDLHVFFFVFLAAPAWMALSLMSALAEGTWSLRGRRWRDLLIPVAPFVAWMGLAYLQTALVKHSLADTAQAKGRTVTESLIFAPRWQGWLAWDPDNRYNAIYLGWVVLAVLGVGLILLAVDAWKRREGSRPRLLLFALICGIVAAIALLALGPNIPRDSQHLVWRAVRHLLPPYKLIRQPAKIFCVLAPFLAVALAMALDRIQRGCSRRGLATGVILVIAAAMAWDYGRRTHPTICLLDDEQGAYRAVADDAARCGRDNRALSLPIWPGDSHWNSLTEYYSTLYRTKMLNGYRPSVRVQYRTEIFDRLAPMNLGFITDDRLDALLERKIGYLIVQEDAYPDKVSPFPVTHTLDALLHHPRIEFLARDAETWAFKILARDASRERPLPERMAGRTWLAARRWWAPDYVPESAPLARDAKGEVTGVWLTNAGSRVTLSPRFLYPIDTLRYLVAARGSGVLCGAFQADSNSVPVTVTAPVTEAGSWVELPVPGFSGASDTILTLSAQGGPVEVGSITLMAGPWPWLQPGQSLTLRADAFFRAGFSDALTGAVHLRVERDPAAVVFYAPNLPLLPGRYRVAVDFATPARMGTEVGSMAMLRRGQEKLASCSLRAGQPAAFVFQHDSRRLLRFELAFNRADALTVRHVTLTRLE